MTEYCDKGTFFHQWYDHDDEYAECKKCKKYKLCKVTCGTPKDKIIVKMCEQCVELEKEERQRDLDMMIESMGGRGR